MDINWQVLISMGITIFVITYFTKRATFAAKEGELKFGLFIWGLGVVSLIFALVPLIVLLTGNYQVDKPGEQTALIGLAIGFGIGAIFTLAEALLSKGSYDNESIIFSTPWTGKKVESWDNLESIHYNGLCYWYVLRFKNGQVIRLSSYLCGHGYVLELLKERGHTA